MPQRTPRQVVTHAPLTVALLALVAILTALALLPVPASAESMQFNARPLPGSLNTELGYFKFDAAAGATVKQVMVLTNEADKPKVIRLAACDGLAAVFGGVAYSENDQKAKAVGSWIQLPETSVTVPAGASVEVPFEVKVPADVTSGVHVGGLSLWEPAAATTSGSGGDSGGASTKITMVTRMVLTVYVTTPGPAVPELKITGVRADARPDGMYLLIDIGNEGTGPTTGEGAITLPDEGFEQPIALGDMVPAASTGYPVKWKTDPAAGDYGASVIVHYGDQNSQTAEWSGNFTVADENLKDLEDRLVAPETPAGAGTPWVMYVLIGGLVLIVLFMGFALLRRRKA